MKKVFVVFLFIFSTVSTFAQSEGESVKPIGGITLYRNVSLAAIEQNNYLDVIVKFKAAELGDYFTNGVKVVVVDNNTGKKIYRKRFSKSYLYVFSDGTCVRDYIHVNDLATAHVLAMDYLRKGGESQVFNLGSGNGFSVKEIIETAKEVTGIDIPVQYGDRRAGDPGTLIASSEKIKNLLGWDPKFSNVADIIKDAWKWHTSHPEGFNSK